MQNINENSAVDKTAVFCCARDEMIFELFGEIKTILQRIAVIVPGHPGSCIC